MRPVLASLMIAALCVSCAKPADQARAPSTAAAYEADPVVPEPSPPAPATSEPVPVALRIERDTTDESTAGFVAMVRDILLDPRGWQQAGFTFSFSEDAPYRVVLLEPAEADAACRPYNVASFFSCQNGPTVVVNAQRWRTATPSWSGSLHDYRVMVVNHEVGHLLGQHHPRGLCSSPGEPAAVMSQQSKGLQGCAPGSWPLPWEIACAARHEEPLAPGPEDPASTTCTEEPA